MGKIKLDKRDVVEIKRLFNETILTDKEIAKLFNVSRIHINQIRNGKKWNYEYEQ